MCETRESVTILLVRHARAGRRERWKGDDRLRPLSKKGRLQAQGVPDLLAPWLTGRRPRLVSSPWVRCIQTLEPVAAAVGVAVVEDEALGEGMGPKAVDGIGDWSGEGVVVLCTHGDVIACVLSALASSGADLGRSALGSAPRGQASPAAKGSVWVLEGDGGAITEGTYLPPPS
jgi:broad specificity phosphatase PhoE